MSGSTTVFNRTLTNIFLVQNTKLRVFPIQLGTTFCLCIGLKQTFSPIAKNKTNDDRMIASNSNPKRSLEQTIIYILVIQHKLFVTEGRVLLIYNLCLTHRQQISYHEYSPWPPPLYTQTTDIKLCALHLLSVSPRLPDRNCTSSLPLYVQCQSLGRYNE